jgi:hypothetical protein
MITLPCGCAFCLEQLESTLDDCQRPVAVELGLTFSRGTLRDLGAWRSVSAAMQRDVLRSSAAFQSSCVTALVGEEVL